MARLTIEAARGASGATEDEYRRLESGDILYFPTTPFAVSTEDRSFLLQQKQVDARYHKNISYRPGSDRLKGVDQDDAAARLRMHAIMRTYSRHAVAFMASFLPRYAGSWRVDFASFRPIEEEGRKVALRARNDLIHVDSFPSRPSQGDRLLRIFTNIHPERARVWITSDPFEALAQRYARQAGLPEPPGPLDAMRRRVVRLLARTGIPVVDRPPYDQFMLRFHHFLKENAAFQRDCPKHRWAFPPGSSWIVFTDTASHACISGQYALEQTFLVSRASLAAPARAPIAIVEGLAGFPLTTARARSA
jgi:hypothetical protein